MLLFNEHFFTYIINVLWKYVLIYYIFFQLLYLFYFQIPSILRYIQSVGPNIITSLNMMTIIFILFKVPI